MAVQIQTRRSSTANDRPFPIRLGSGELALNNNSTSPGLFFADNTASPNTGLIKVGPVHIGSTAPNTGAAGFTCFKHCYDAGVNFKATGDCLVIAPMFICEKKHIDEIIEKLRTGITNYTKSKKN